ncbi:hypothetical protein GS4_32_01110 [Gordonia soli NBRC 108243]|uniref:Uncharacterized protein n=1 Tax=Gordonia soli NBRC 108243 TaxID=1223545 RepID=M0QRK5_9ACTN|nr:hypothetical protein GS4_32_01110 [Gordonia soli NBRC 108243]
MHPDPHVVPQPAPRPVRRAPLTFSWFTLAVALVATVVGYGVGVASLLTFFAAASGGVALQHSRSPQMRLVKPPSFTAGQL